MPSTEDEPPLVDDATLGVITAGLVRDGSAVVDNAIPRSIIDTLRAELIGLNDDAFNRAGIGRGNSHHHTDEIRRDRIHWLEPATAASMWYFHWFDSLRRGLNRNLMLGLFDYECHLAWYSPGAFYATHVDAFHGEDNRKVSTVLYLNDDWQPGDGGELVLHEPVGANAKPNDSATPSITRVVNPTGGTLACFLSEEIPHQVLDAATDRFSIAGWYRVNSGGALS